MIGTEDEAVFGSITETTCFLSYFRDLPDARQAGKVIYPLNEMLLMALLGVLARAESFTDIARFGERKLALLRRFLPFADGTSPHDTLGDIFATLHDVAWLGARHDWPGLKVVIIVESQREIGEKIEREARFYITSTTLEAKLWGPMIRDQWAVENSLHWVMDMTFRDDECRIRTEHAPANFTTLRHMAHNLLPKAPGKDALRLRRKTAARDDDCLVSLIAA